MLIRVVVDLREKIKTAPGLSLCMPNATGSNTPRLPHRAARTFPLRPLSVFQTNC